MVKLPPHGLRIDYTLTLEKNKNEKEKTPPWGLLYGITCNKLLVLWKTLNKFLDKGFIRANNSPAKAPVLFTKKKRGLRFYIDYRGLNNITKKDHYLLSLMKKTLNNIFKVKYFTKLDVMAVFYQIYITKG